MGDEDHNAEVRKRLTRIEQKSDAMNDCLTWLVRANAERLLPKLLADFGGGERRIGVYLALDGQRSVDAVAKHLGMKAYNVSIELNWLKERSLVRVKETSRLGKIYVKEDFDGIVELTRNLEAQLKKIQKKKAEPNGKSAKATKKIAKVRK